MKSFSQFLAEAGRLYRFDDQPITPRAQTYAISPDRTSSGNISGWKPPPDWSQETGLFAGHYGHVLSFAVPRDIRWVVTGKRTEDSKPTIYFAKADKQRIDDHTPTLSVYNRRQGFQRTSSGEWFAPGGVAPEPLSQTRITDPLSHIGKHYNVQFVDDIVAHKKGLESEGIHHSAEGDFDVG
jgi:hypothetical protein